MSPQKIKFNANQKRLIRRYLIWCYKTTKEQLDRIDRYFTQLEADQFLLGELMQHKDYTSEKSDPEYRRHVEEFKKYMSVKKTNVLKQKFADEKNAILQPEYQYVQNRFRAIEKAIIYFLGNKELKQIIDLYEQEMTQRILQAREHV